MTTLKKIDKLSAEGAESSLNIFDLPFSNVAINKSTVRELLPLTTITQGGPYVFRIWADNQFLDLRQTWLYLELSIQKLAQNNTDWINIETYAPAVGAIAAVGDNVGVCQSVGQSFVRQLKLSMNNVEIFDSGVLYPYRNYIMKELMMSYESKKGLYEAEGYQRDDDDPNNAANKGLEKRVKAFSNGVVFKSMAKLNFDLAQQPNYILNNTDVLFTIYRNSDEFLLHIIDGPAQRYRIKIHDIKLYVKTIDVTQSLQTAISKMLERAPAKYAMRKIDVRSAFIGKGRVDFHYNIFNSIIPRRMIIGFVSADAFSGHVNKSPFVFEHAKIRTICAEANGNTYPSTAYNLNFATGDYIRPFVDMYVGMGLDESNHTNGITMYRYKKAWCFFVIPMQSTLEDSDGFELIRNGTTAIKIAFHEAVPDIGYEMVVLAEFDHIITIDRDRVLTSDSAI